MSSNEQIVRDFIGAWSRLNVDELLAYFTEDGVYYNMPIAPVSGHKQLRPFIAAFLKGWTATEWDILNVVSAGDVVIAERLDRIRVGDKAVNLPCCGVFEMQDGKIKVWRDYFDMATYTKALAG
jgi:limonene-1,2-epoxide hydrolase